MIKFPDAQNLEPSEALIILFLVEQKYDICILLEGEIFPMFLSSIDPLSQHYNVNHPLQTQSCVLLKESNHPFNYFYILTEELSYVLYM